ncbi:unnamed protein product [Leptidea sinapis]|uniref:glycogenin glucosyltransferase n=1 Tax=Leptidea sinapis TaxID=189913 RepID=A0A5E4QWU8_9NEOP|nr:unnamed protein product [Leptidea sinapis]
MVCDSDLLLSAAFPLLFNLELAGFYVLNWLMFVLHRAWVTLATNDSYGLGALVVAHSLRRVGSSYPAVVLITPSVTAAMRERLRAVFAEVIAVDVLDSQDAAHLALLQRPELGITFTKIHCWNLTQYEKCVFLDADILVVQNCDELFEREELSAAPDVGWPDCFNSGVFVFQPSADTFSRLIAFGQERGSFDGGDQGLLNSYFSNWSQDTNKRLPFLYNVTSAAFYSYLPALKHYGQDLKIIHFIGAAKPWLQQYNFESRSVDAPEHLKGFLQLWWDLFTSQVHTQLDTTMEYPQDVSPATKFVAEDHSVEAFDNFEPELNVTTYKPVVDSTSEFPWHHPNQTAEDICNESSLDKSEFHDPWDGFRGNIPPAICENKVLDGSSKDHVEVRTQAWKYVEPHTDTHKQYSQIPYEINNHSHTPHQPVDEQNNFDSHDNKNTNFPNHHHFYTDSSDQKLIFNSFENQSTPQEHTVHNILQHSEINENLSTNHNKHKHAYTLQNDLESTLSQRKHRKKDEIDHELPQKFRNGHICEEDDIIYDDIIPRHPYDGFYLRHRVTIDSHGQKICSHEVPPPSYSSCSDSSEEYEDTIETLENGCIAENNHETGVAGNLARVVPGVPLQREALDELTRRQGWETGNIDYMGADSFANIWAKISQTLDQSPKQPSPPKESPPAEAPAKDSVEELAEKVATSVISEPEPANIPVPASEAAQAAGKTTIPSNVDILVPECTPEINPTVKSDISEPKGTVAAEDSVQHVTSCEPSKLDTEPVNEPAIPLEIPSQEKPAEQITVNVLPVLSSNNSESKNGSSTEIKPDSSVESVAVPEKTEIPPTQTHVVSQTEPQLPDQLHVTECPIQQSEAKPVLNTSDVSDEQNKSELHEEPKPTPTSTELKEAPKPVATDVHEPKLESESLDTKSGPVSDVAHEKAQVIESAISEVVSETQLVEPKLDTTKTEIVTTISEQDKSPSKTEVPVSASDSPPLANTPSQDEIPIATVAKSLEEAAQETRL